MAAGTSDYSSDFVVVEILLKLIIVVIVKLVTTAPGILDAATLHGNNNKAKPSLGDHVKHSVEDGFTVGGDGASAFGEDPDDGVEGPSEDSESNDVIEATEEPNVGGNGTGDVTPGESRHNVACGIVDVVVDDMVLAVAEVVDDGEEVEHGEGEEDPPIRVAYSGANESGSNHENVLEEEVVPNVIVEVAKVDKAMEHEGGGDDPVEVTSVVKFAAIAAADVETVGGGHCEVSEGSKEAYNTTDEGRVSEEAVDVFASCRTNAEVSSAVSHISNVMVTEVAVDVVNRGQKEKDESNPKSDSASSGNPVEAGIDEVAVGSD